MQAVIDLNPRQASRVVEQAVRSRAALEIEARTLPRDGAMRGVLVGREDELLRVDLDPSTQPLPLHALLGACCDIRTVLSGQLYLFSTCVIDAFEHNTPQRLLLAMPETIHVANRRRFERRTLKEFSQVRLWPSESKTPYIGELCNISGDGLACRMVRGELDELLLVGDGVRVCFDLPSFGESFDLPAVVCNKSTSHDELQLIVGLEYQRGPATEPAATAAIERLWGILCEMTTNLSGMDGES